MRRIDFWLTQTRTVLSEIIVGLIHIGTETFCELFRNQTQSFFAEQHSWTRPGLPYVFLLEDMSSFSI